jgi:hypothetical protein
VRAEIAEIRRLAEEGDAEARALLEGDPMANAAPAGGPGAAGGLLEARLPLGPFLALGCVEFLFARRAILDLVQRYLAPH